jgi:hypothetical protein
MNNDHNDHVKLYHALRTDWLVNTLIMPWNDYLKLMGF